MYVRLTMSAVIILKFPSYGRRRQLELSKQLHCEVALAQNKNINCISIITLEGILKTKSEEKNDKETV